MSALKLLVNTGLTRAGGGGPAPDPFGVLARASGGNGTAGTTHTVNLPSNAIAGRLLLLVFRTASTGTNHTTPAGWDLIASAAAGSGGRMSIYSRVTNGLEGASVTVTTAAERESAWVTYLIGGVDTQALTYVEAATNTTANLNMPALTPSWGQEENVWLAIVTAGRTDNVITTPPANYVNPVSAVSTPSVSSNNSCQVISAERVLDASSETPGAFTNPGTIAAHTKATIAVKPA